MISARKIKARAFSTRPAPHVSLFTSIKKLQRQILLGAHPLLQLKVGRVERMRFIVSQELRND